MNTLEKKSSITLALIMSFRMLGLFMILPVFTLYAEQLPDATPKLIGIALGIYGLTQGLLQMPFGMLSDKWGRKPIIFMGLIIFVIGSIIAALSHSIYGIIIGRALQGSGAIGSTVIALTADLTREQVRTKAMAIIGISIGTSFSLAMILGPLLASSIGVPGIFWLTAILAVSAMLMVFYFIPTTKVVVHPDAEPMKKMFKQVLCDKKLLRLDLGIFIQHAVMTATFVVIPIALQNNAHIMERDQWWIYLPVLLASYLLMVPFIILAEKKGKMKPIFVSSIMILIMSQLILFFFHVKPISFIISLLLFFTAFTILEATLPSQISKLAPPHAKGTATGIYSTAQFLGIFFGGTLGGLLLGAFGLPSIFLFCAIMLVVWFLVAVV